MSYVCKVCNAKVPHGTIQRRHSIKADDGRITGEIQVCQDCEVGLKSGRTVEQMIQIRRIESKAEGPSELVKKVLAGAAKPKQVPTLVQPSRPAAFKKRTP